MTIGELNKRFAKVTTAFVDMPGGDTDPVEDGFSVTIEGEFRRETLERIVALWRVAELENIEGI